MEKIVQKTASNHDMRHKTPIKIRMATQNAEDAQTKKKNIYQTIQAQQKHIILNLEFRIKRLNEEHEKTKRELENKIKTLTKEKNSLEYALIKSNENESKTEKQNINTHAYSRNISQNIRGIDNGFRMENLRKNLFDASLEVSVKREEIEKLKKDNLELAKVDDEKTKEIEKLKLQIAGLRKNIQELRKDMDLKSSIIDRYEVQQKLRNQTKQIPKTQKTFHLHDHSHHHNHQKIDNSTLFQIKHLELELVKANYKNKGLAKTIDAMNDEFMRNNMVFLNKRMNIYLERT